MEGEAPVSKTPGAYWVNQAQIYVKYWSTREWSLNQPLTVKMILLAKLTSFSFQQRKNTTSTSGPKTRAREPWGELRPQNNFCCYCKCNVSLVNVFQVIDMLVSVVSAVESCNCMMKLLFWNKYFLHSKKCHFPLGSIAWWASRNQDFSWE